MVLSFIWTLISRAWPQWKLSHQPHHGCVHQDSSSLLDCRIFLIVPGVNGFHASAANLWTVQQPGTKALNFKVDIAPCWDLSATVPSGLSVFPPPPECWWEADSAGVPGGLKGRPLYCSGAVTLWWTCVIVEGKWGFNGRSLFSAWTIFNLSLCSSSKRIPELL